MNNATYPATKVNGQSDLRERIRNEYYWEIGGEDSMYFHELRWGTWKDKKFDNNRNGLMQMWGENDLYLVLVGGSVLELAYSC